MVMTSAGAVLRDEMTTRAPKDEGNMSEEATFRVSRDGLSVQVGYSPRRGFKRAWKKGGFKSLWQEFGTVHHSAQPFVRPAYRAKLAQILNYVDRAVKRTIIRGAKF
jgi:HK97 gp10 family phage protein